MPTTADNESSIEMDVRLDEGDDEVFDITRTKDDGSVQPLSGFTFTLTIKDSFRDPDSEALIQIAQSNHIDAPNGKSQITVPGTDTTGKSGIYVYTLVENDANGETKTLARGRLTISDQ
jgi:hypothetical protein